jgi:type II secretory pathway pseudopilin PulG
MSRPAAANRNGFILVEALIALVIVGIAFLALEGSLSVVIRSLADSEREAIAARIAEAQRERTFAQSCAFSTGSDSSDGVAVTWTATPSAPASHTVRVVQTSRFTRRLGDVIRTYDAVGACQ